MNTEFIATEKIKELTAIKCPAMLESIGYIRKFDPKRNVGNKILTHGKSCSRCGKLKNF